MFQSYSKLVFNPRITNNHRLFLTSVFILAQEALSNDLMIINMFSNDESAPWNDY